MPDNTKTARPHEAYSLAEPLPSDVLVHTAGGLTSYRNYPVFSAPWFWRRTALFAPLAAGLGLVQAATAAATLRDWHLGVLAAAIGVPIWVAIVTAGPLFATLVRHRGWPAKLERGAVVLAVSLGLGVSFTGQYIAEVQSHKILGPKYATVMPVEAMSAQRAPHPALVAVIFGWEFILFFSVGGGLALRTYFSEQKRWGDAQRAREIETLRRQKNEADLKLTVLQAQVEPHFLFNTLASVHSLVRQDPQRAEATVEALVDHLRATMPKVRADIGSARSTLAEQIDVCESYLAVMKVRMGPRLQYTVDVPAPLRAHFFPPLVLISLVENAIKHGIEPNPAAGNIVLRAEVDDRSDGRQLAVSVIDDGIGLRPGTGHGVGLENIRAQLAARFGAHGGFSIQGRPEGGVTATIRVPYARASP